ncbi:MAG: hypothetical protein ACRCS8_04545 [Brevinema sp.]
MNMTTPQSSNFDKKLKRQIALALGAVALTTYLVLGSKINFLFFQHPAGKVTEKVLDDIKKHQEEFINQNYLYTEKNNYKHFEPIEVFVKLEKQYSSNSVLNLVVRDDTGKVTRNIFNDTRSKLSYISNADVYHISWYPKDTTYQGVLTLEVEATLSLFNQKFILDKSVYVSLDHADFKLPHAYTFLGMDSKAEIVARSILSVKGKAASKNDLVDWFDLYNNDAVVMPMAVTKTFDTDPTRQINIWDVGKLNENLALIKNFSSKKIKSAVWIQALEIDGAFRRQLGYMESIRSNAQQTNVSWISIRDNKRRQDIKKMFGELSSNNDISFIGFSKALFYKDFHNGLREEFENTFSNIIPLAPNAFEQWKQYQIIEYYRDILTENKKKKPIFFIFSGRELLENPQMMDMAFDVGADFVMLDIQTTLPQISKQLELIKKHTSFDKFHDKIVLSYQLDHNNAFSGSVSSLENWVHENLRLLSDEHVNSLRIQDFYRALFGNRGAYPAYQWMLMIGDLISKWKERQFVFPLQHRIIPDKTEISDHVTLNIEFFNRSNEPIKNYHIELLPVAKVSNMTTIIKLPTIKAREVIRTNITLSNVEFDRGALKRRTHFIGLVSQYDTKGFNKLKQVHMLPFIDTSVTTDIDVIENTAMSDIPDMSEAVFEEESVELEPIEDVVSNTNEVKKPEPVATPSTPKPAPKKEEPKKEEETKNPATKAPAKASSKKEKVEEEKPDPKAKKKPAPKNPAKEKK